MSSSFTNGSTAVQPLVIDGWDSSRESQNVLQQVIGGGVDALLRPAAPRSGTLSAVFVSMADAFALEALLSAGEVVDFADSDLPILDMSFVTSGAIRISKGEDAITLEDGTETFAWSVGFDFQQVTT